MLLRASSVFTLAFLMAGSLPGQIPSSARPLGAPLPNAPALLVANPYTAVAADSATAVEIGTALRKRMIDKVVGRDWNVISREKMNEALVGYGYPADGILTAQGARDLARSMSGTRTMIFPTLTKLPSGRYHLRARLTGTFNANDMAGYLVARDQAPDQSLEKFAESVADLFKPALKALHENEVCFAQMYTDTEKATKAAQEALELVANFAPAEYCLGKMAMLNDSTSKIAEQHFRDALKTDSLALDVYGELGVIYQVRDDTAQVVSTYQQMLRVEPLNQLLRETAFKLFRAYGSQDAAELVADEGIKNDPSNTDWYDLKSNACLAQEKFNCAIDELETLFSVDSSKADSAFYVKINAATRFGDDTVRYAKWAAKGIAKYPDNVILLQDAARAFAWVGDVEGAIDATRRVVALAPDDLEPIRVVAVLLGQAGQGERVIEFIPIVKASGDPDLQNTIGSVLVNAASQIAATEPAKADTLAQAALDVGVTDANLLAYANYFIAANMMQSIQALSQSVREAKTCAATDEYRAVLERTRAALIGAALTDNAQIKAYTAQTLPSVEAELNDFIPKLRQAVCK